ncbi:MAG: HlyD family efflux transporter periplasmic adaptor subunit, partial [Comamonadaceae bacterium]
IDGRETWLLHNYLFFRVPLVRPQDGLARAMPYLNWIYTRTTAFAVIGLTLLGLFLAARQWETFTSTIVDHLSWSGIVGYAVALVFAKTLHELGHAVTATRYGVRVAHMGVAMLVMFPMLYTDTSESWKLTRSRQRLAIASAGLVTEMALAGLCTLGWALAPDGPVGNGLFFLATTSWVLTLLINVSPFMRFDGYFILTDILDFPNLHERGGALARTWMRRTLLGFEDDYPERLPGRGNALAIAFALTTWVYRLTVFLGIALLVYHFAFKLLGIFLMGVELVWFIGKPVANELGVWRKRKSEIKPNRKVAGWALLAVVLAVLMVPWPTAVHGPGWVHPERQQQIFSPLAGRITAVPKEGAVTQGQLLFALESPDLKLSEQRSTDQAAARAQELLGLSGLPDGEERRAQIRSQQDKFLAEASMYTGEQSRLQVAAPFAGQLGDLDPLLTPGVWVQPRQPLAIVTDPSRWTVEAFIEEEDVARVRVGDSARVYIGMRSLETVHGQVVEVDPGRTLSLPHAMLDANAGGPIVTVKPPAEQRYLERPPRDAIYRVRIALDAPPRGVQMMLAKVVIAGEGRAW